jgi:long-chain acyl-CoA synthetase
MENLIALLGRAAEEFPESAALEGEIEGAGRVSLTRPGLLGRAAALAEALIASGTRPGDAVGLLSPNRPEWAVGYFGVLLAGGVVVPFDVNLKPGEWANILERSGAAAMVVDDSLDEAARALADSLEKRLPVFRLDETGAVEAHPLSKWPGADRGAEDLALISFSSGTTGAPKGVMLTHGNISSNALAVAESYSCGPEDVFLSVLPLHHMFESTAGFLVPLIRGSKVFYLASLNPRLLVEAMQGEGVSVCLAVPALARLIHRRIMASALSGGWARRAGFRALFALSKAALALGFRAGEALLPEVKRRLGPRLRFFGSGGAALDPAIARDLLALGIEVVQGYGLTESSPVTHANHPGRRNRIGTVGPPIPGVEVRIEPAGGAGAGEGEILIRGPGVMKGYFDNPELTAEVLRDGWLHTGDIGQIGRGGYLTICGRSKNVIVAESGMNIYPEEIEEELSRSALLGAVCVLGKKTPRGGEEVFAVIAPGEEADLPAEDAARTEAVRAEIERLSHRLAGYKRIKDFVIWPGAELPQTTTLKFKREEIKEALRRMSGFGPGDF